jgi:hypothetical protein
MLVVSILLACCLALMGVCLTLWVEWEASVAHVARLRFRNRTKPATYVLSDRWHTYYRSF